MKKILLFILLSYSVQYFSYAQSTLSAEDKWKKEWPPRTAGAALRGDVAAQAVFAKMDEKDRLGFLKNIAINRRVDKPMVDKALEMIKKIPGHCEFYRNQILSDKAGDSSARYDAFAILARLKTEESIKILGEMLFDPSQPNSEGSSDVPPPSPNRIIALISLSEAKLEGAPTGPVTGDNAESKLKEYQQWWLKKHPRK